MMWEKVGYSKPSLIKDILKLRLWRHNSVLVVTNKILLRDSVYIVDVAMSAKVGNSNISMR